MPIIPVVIALPKAEAIVCFIQTIKGVYRRQRIAKINRNGEVSNNIEHNEKVCTGLIMLENMLYVIHESYVQTLNFSQFKTGLGQRDQISSVKYMTNTACLFHDPSQIRNKDLLLLADWEKHEIFTYRLSTKQKEVHVRGLKHPRSVSYIFDNNNTFYLVCSDNEVGIYNSTWGLVRNIGKTGSRKEKLAMPSSAMMLPDGNLVIADYFKRQVSEYSVDGRFIDILWIGYDFWPLYLTFSHPHLWVLSKQDKLYRYKLYKNEPY